MIPQLFTQLFAFSEGLASSNSNIIKNINLGYNEEISVPRDNKAIVDVSCQNNSIKINLQSNQSGFASSLENNGQTNIEIPSSNENLSSTTPKLFNFSLNEAYDILFAGDDGYLDQSTEYIFITIYVILIISGVVGNVMVGYVIWRKKAMRTPRNLYIINLTLSDLSMCVVSMPFTIIRLLHKNWHLGSIICKLIPVLQCANVLVSTATIVAIAADRYVTIVRVGQPSRNRCHVATSLVAIWVFSFLFTLPLYSYYYVDQVKISNILLYEQCIEKWPSSEVKEFWVLLLMFIQYIFPIFVLSVVHASIKIYLGRHMIAQNDPRRAQRELERNRKTTILLSTIAVIFAVSWLPWHVVNLLADYNYALFHSDSRHFYTVFGSCHIIAMSSACTNPVLYGWLNTNLRRELLDFLPGLLQKMGWVLPDSWKRRLMSNNNTFNIGDSPTRPPESVTLFVFQANPTNSVQTTAQAPITTTVFIKDET